MIGSGSLACPTPKQIPLASARVSSNNGKVRAGADFLVRYAGWNYDHVPSIHLDIAAVLAANSQSRSATINSERFVRCAVVMRKGIDAVSPRVGPVVFRKALFDNGSAIFRLRCERVPIDQQRQVAVWENVVVLKSELLRFNQIPLVRGRMGFHMHCNIA